MTAIRRAGEAAGTLLLACLVGCTTSDFSSLGPAPSPGPSIPSMAHFTHAPLDAAEVEIRPERGTIEQSWLLDLYTLFHDRGYRSFEVRFPGAVVREATAHLTIPPGQGPFPTVIVLPILGGDHVVSEMVGKALVDHGFAVARLERQPLGLETATEIEVVRDALTGSVLDSRRLLDWLVTHPAVDRSRIAAAGISLGSLQVVLLAAADERIAASLFLLSGGGLAEIFYDSTERPVRAFRNRLIEANDLADRDAFLTWARPRIDPVDPARFAPAIRPGTSMLVNGRFDRVIPRDRADQLWESLGRPTRLQLPTGHYQAFPFLWMTIARGAEHLRNALGGR